MNRSGGARSSGKADIPVVAGMGGKRTLLFGFGGWRRNAILKLPIRMVDCL